MKEHFRENYFLLLKMIIILVLDIYIILELNILAGASYQVLLFSACFLTGVLLNEFYKNNIIFLIMEGISAIVLITFYDQQFILLMPILILEVLSHFKISIIWHLTLYIPLIFVRGEYIAIYFIIISFVFIIYFQHMVVINSYKEQLKAGESSELSLKKNLHRQEAKHQEEIGKSILKMENDILEEKSRLSQAMHDKLGHSINGSIYQLEACKILLDRDKESSRSMIEAVIYNLRNSMDEIRMILRKERPDKYKLAMIQLQGLCDDCIAKGIDATVNIVEHSSEVFNASEISEKYLEIILDNAFEAVSNSLKHSKCNSIKIEIVYMNQMIRCTISDNGVGCKNIADGMGLSGMRKRMRSVNGMIDFESEIGFTINMLFPLN